MLLGLRMMEESAKQAFLEELALKPTGDTDQTLIEWMGRASRAKGDSAEEIELSVLRWLATRIGCQGFENLELDELEASVRRKVAEDSHDFLFPFMEVGSAIAYLGPLAVVEPKLELLEASTVGLIPSSSARDRMRQYWKARGAKLLQLGDVIQADALLSHLQEPLEILVHCSDATKAAILSLSQVVALSDGRYEVEEEQFSKGLAERLGVPFEKLQQISAEITQWFWKHLRELEGTSPKQRNTSEELALSLRAAQLTLESVGSLASFSDVVERGFVGSIHNSIGKTRKKRGSFTLGFATGMLCFIRDKWRSDDHETLLRLALAALYRQHLHVAAEQAEITSSDVKEYIEDRRVENPADTLAETMVGREKIQNVRKISLD
ncbi:MAG: hypothetical protein WC314_06450 [Vulcanimicrobiota bacterium]